MHLVLPKKAHYKHVVRKGACKTHEHVSSFSIPVEMCSVFVLDREDKVSASLVCEQRATQSCYHK